LYPHNTEVRSVETHLCISPLGAHRATNFFPDVYHVYSWPPFLSVNLNSYECVIVLIADILNMQESATG